MRTNGWRRIFLLSDDSAFGMDFVNAVAEKAKGANFEHVKKVLSYDNIEDDVEAALDAMQSNAMSIIFFIFSLPYIL